MPNPPNPLNLPLVAEGSEANGPLPLLWPGVHGCAILAPETGIVYVPVLYAVNEGSGAVGALLDAMTRTGGYAIPTIISTRLEGMLVRRGWKPRAEPAPEYGPRETAEVWHPPTQPPP